MIQRFVLTPFEEYFYVDDRPSYPAVFFFKLVTKGTIDREYAQQAFDIVATRHVLTRAKIGRDRRGRLEWSVASASPKIQWGPESFGDPGLSAYPPMKPMDLELGPPIQIHCLETTQGHDIVFQVHHAAFDGLGYYQVVRDWLQVYQKSVAPDRLSRKLREYDTELLAGRCRPALKFNPWRKLLPGQWKSVRAAIQFVGRHPIPMVPMEAEKRLRDKYQASPDVISRKLDKRTTEALRASAQKLDSTVNNILARDLFLAIDHWQKKHQIQSDGSHLRIMIPVNERTSDHRKMPACNHCTLINLDRRIEELRDAQTLHDGIRQEMNVIKKWRLSLNFWRALSLFRRLPGGLHRQTHSGGCGATCLLTNLGNAEHWLRVRHSDSQDRQDEISIEEIEMVAPLRTGMYAAFAVFYFQRELHLTMHIDTRMISSADGADLLETFLAKIAESCCQDPPISFLKRS